MLRRLYNWMLEKAAHRHAERWLFLFAFVEASFFPIPPHPLLGLMCLSKPKRALRYGAICTLGSVVGGLLGYAIGYFAYDAFGAQLLHWLGLAQKFPVAACYLREYGWQLIIVKGATPIPFKLVTITAGFIHLNLFTFIWASIVSRGFQFMLVGVLFRLFGAWAKAFIEKYLGLLTIAFVILVVGGFLAIGALEGGHGGTSDRCATATIATQAN
ncbi:YqaA family protein [Stakelama sediminis]|uniref:Membrane protein YqaA with SNARE-associated domain n=1 Tax=Stakelama sediminis TaxID=463200 RepID=A0A840Z106_9SPHN|nr:YqaA family protein [Stakelama sediminis]MBB5719605.1 membrane protein YqaA with SNARE-associated domain [Stakelama sediminis]